MIGNFIFLPPKVRGSICDAFTIKSAEDAANRNFYCTMPGAPPSWLSSGIGFMQLYKAKFGGPGSYSPVLCFEIYASQP